MIDLKQYIEESLLDNFDRIESNQNPEEEVIKFLQDNYYGHINTYTIHLGENGKYVVDVNNDLNPKKHKLKTVTNGMFEFNQVWGSVDFQSLNITSLEGAPKVVYGSFDCSRCQNLTSLEGAPKRVSETFACSQCKKLTSLEGAPSYVGEYFYCKQCDSLKSLKGSPDEIHGGFDCSQCKKLTSLEGAPSHISGNFFCDRCESLRSLKGAPQRVSGDFDCSGCPKLQSLKDLPEKIGRTLKCNSCGVRFTMNDIEKLNIQIGRKDIIDL